MKVNRAEYFISMQGERISHSYAVANDNNAAEAKTGSARVPDCQVVNTLEHV